MIILDIYYSADRCGAGKTTWALERMAGEPGRYVFVVDRIENAERAKRELNRLTEERGTVAHIEIISADDGAKTVGGVGVRIMDAGLELSGNRHVIVVITHAGMIRVKDWERFKLWTAIIIDEVPAICEREEHPSTAWLMPVLSRFYGLKPVSGTTSLLTFKRGLTHADVPPEWRSFHNRALTGEAMVDLTDWEELAERTDPWSSWRIWDVTKLDGVFDEVTFLADGFADTETYHLMALNPVVRFIAKVVVPDHRSWKERAVTIRYVSEERRAASSRFRSADHAEDMAKVWQWLATVDDDHHLWTANNGVDVTSPIRGSRVTPKQAGSNAYRAWHKASVIYAAKPSPSERKFFKSLGIDPDVIVASREAYDINQFFMRTSLRVPDSVEAVELRCFDRHQAETFAAKLSVDYGLSADLEHDDIGLSQAPVNVGGRPPKNGRKAMTQEERREADRLRKQNQRAKMKEAA